MATDAAVVGGGDLARTAGNVAHATLVFHT
jgi:hypothetical protein